MNEATIIDMNNYGLEPELNLDVILLSAVSRLSYLINTYEDMIITLNHLKSLNNYDAIINGEEVCDSIKYIDCLLKESTHLTEKTKIILDEWIQSNQPYIERVELYMQNHNVKIE